MAMMVDWEYFFPAVYFKHNRFESWSKEDLSKVLDKDGNWDPQKDFEFHLQKLKVDLKYFDQKNKTLFPEGFTKPIYSIETFEEARLTLLNRIQISFVEEKEKYYYDDSDKETCTVYSTYKIEIQEADKSINVENGMTIGDLKWINKDGKLVESSERELKVWGKKNVITSHRFNAINILYDWLIGLNPRGAYDNTWQVFAYGITEYEETLSCVDTFVVNIQKNQKSLPGFEIENNNFIISQSVDKNFDNIQLAQKESASDVRLRLKDWNPFISN
jgi:hypothetical protein